MPRTVTLDDAPPAHPTHEPLLFGFPAAARRLGVTESWLRRAVTAKKVPHRRIGNAVRFSADDLAQIVAASAVTVDEAPPATPRPTRRRTA